MIVETQDTMRFKRNKIEDGWETLPTGKVFSRAYGAPTHQQPVVTSTPEALVSTPSTESVELLAQPVVSERPSVQTECTIKSPLKSPRSSESGSFSARFRSFFKSPFRDKSPKKTATTAKKEEKESQNKGQERKLRGVFKHGIDVVMHKQPVIPTFERSVSQVRQLVRNSQRYSERSSSTKRS